MEPWAGTLDLGLQFKIDVTWEEIDKEQEEIYYNKRKKDWDSKMNVRRAIIGTLNKAVPKAYCRGSGIQVNARQYRVSDYPRVLLDKLHDLYGRMMQQEKTNMELSWSAPWTPTETIKVLIDRLEDCFVLVKRNTLRTPSTRWSTRHSPQSS